MKSIREFVDRPIPSTRLEHARSEPNQAATYEFLEEPMIDLGESGLAFSKYYASSDGLNWPYCRSISTSPCIRLRQGLVARLLLANNYLFEFGLEVLVLDGLRTLEDQISLWKFFTKRIRDQNPDLSEVQVREEAKRYCWDPAVFDKRDPGSWPVHMTGGSVDLTLRAVGTREQCFMGSVFDDANSISHTAHFETCLSQVDYDFERLTNSQQAALLCRRALYHSMENVGLTNYPAEWWHFDFHTVLQTLHSQPNYPILIYGITE